MKPNPPRAREVLTTAWAWPHMSERESPEGWTPVDGPNHHWLVSDDGMACFPIVRNRQCLWEIHAAVIPEARKRSREYARQAITWAKLHTDCRYLQALIGCENRAARSLARSVGMKELCELPGALRSGDAVMYGLEMRLWAA